MEIKSAPNQRTFGTEIGESRVSVPGSLSSIFCSRQIQNPATPATYREHAVDAENSKGHMPRFDAEMPPADIELLARFVVSRARSIPIGKVARPVAPPPSASAAPHAP